MKRWVLGVALSAALGCDATPAAPLERAQVTSSGCRTNGDCAAVDYCDFEPGLCGHGKDLGHCAPRSRSCQAGADPVCGCDHRVYEGSCAAAKNGVDLDVNGGCREKLVDFMACGSRFCDARTSYCEIVLSDVAELPSDYTCKPLPSACLPSQGRAAACSCFSADTRCLSFCGPIETGGELAGIHLTCRL